MNKKSIITALLVLVTVMTSAQRVMLADSITRNPVSYATVYDADGTVMGRSDMGGYIHLQKGFEYHISHISYEPKSLVQNEDSIILLSPSSYKISEVNDAARKKKYYHCKVYFRSIEHVDSCLKVLYGRNTRIPYRHQKQKGALRQYRNELLYVKEKRHCTEKPKHDDWRQVHGFSVS